MHQFELLVPPAGGLYQGLEGELVAVDLVEQRLQQGGTGGGEAQPARQPVSRLGGAAGAGTVILVGGQGGGQRLLPREIAHFDGLDGIVLFPLRHGGQGIDMGLQQLELAELSGETGKGVFQFVHLLTQGGGGGKGVHRHILSVPPIRRPKVTIRGHD
ncbi:hypothetical protein D3C84_559440 [compost metagenome]